jgi:hypothetical protein
MSQVYYYVLRFGVLCLQQTAYKIATPRVAVFAVSGSVAWHIVCLSRFGDAFKSLFYI